jgi:regulatory protein
MRDNPDVKTAMNKAMALCARREFCSEDIRIKLNSWGLNDIDANKVVGVLIRENFINEDRFANAFVKDKFRYNKWGRVKIAAYLGAKKINPEAIRSALASIDDEQYRETVKNILSVHRKSIKAANRYELKGKLLRFGLSRGYESNLLYDLLNDLD